MTHRFPDDNAAEERRAVYAGSFDPFTRGHLSIAERAAAIFDRLIIAIGYNAAKAPSPQALESRREAIVRAIDKLPESLRGRCEVMVYSGELTVDFARKHGARWLVRGARTGTEFESEMALADINRTISGIETVIIPALPALASCSSSVVRELWSYGRDAAEFLP